MEEGDEMEVEVEVEVEVKERKRKEILEVKKLRKRRGAGLKTKCRRQLLPRPPVLHRS